MGSGRLVIEPGPFSRNTLGKPSPANLPDKVAFEEINDLVARRNEVAHGDVDTLLARPLLRDYIQFVRSTAAAVTRALESEVWRFEIRHHGFDMPAPLKAYSQSCVVCFPSAPDCGVRVGDRMFAVSGDGQLFSSIIDRIEIDGHEKAVIPPKMECAFGVKLSFGAKENWSYTVVPRSPG